MINFCMAPGGPYRSICESITDPIREHLPDSVICPTEQSGATNVGFFVTQTNCQVFIPHGIADKNYRNADKVNAFEYVFVSGPAWVDKLVRQGFPRDRILVGGYTKLDPVFQGKYEQTRRTSCVILYAPTHGAIPEVSLDGRFEQYLPHLEEYYVVIHAPHPAQVTGQKNGGQVTMQALVDADIVITDAGSLVYEAWALGKPVVFPSWLTKEGVLGRFSGSFEEQIYREEIGYHATDYNDLLRHLKRAALFGIDDRAVSFIEQIFPVELRGRSGEVTANLLRRFEK